MTVLLVETRQSEAEFDRRWQAWQHAQNWMPPPCRPVARALADHFPFLVYEYFPTVGFGAARHVALASRAEGMASRLSQRAPEAAEAGRAQQWLHALAQDELSSVLAVDSPVWQLVVAARRRFWHACQRERTNPRQVLAAGEFWSSLAAKAAPAQAIAATFAELSGCQRPLAPLTESQIHLYAGLVLYHGCLAWQQDFVDGQPSQVVACLLAELDGACGTTAAHRAARLPEAARLFHYGGHAQRALDQAADHFCRAMAAVTELPPGSWGALLIRLLHQVRQLDADLGRIRGERLARARISPPATAPHRSATPQGSPAAAGAAYLHRQQTADGYWGDFLLLAEQSTSWVTGYVGWNLAGPTAGDPAEPTGAAARWLVEHQVPGGGWSYNSHWPVDLDSTANVLLFLQGRAELPRDRWQPALDRLLEAQQPDGGFATVIDPEAWLVRFRTGETDLRGWTAPHPCVTAVVTLLLARLGGTRELAAAARGLAWLLGYQEADGYWNAYWWAGRLYTTCRTLQAIQALPVDSAAPAAAARAAAVRAAAWLIGSQHTDGGWSATADERPAAFHTALAVRALCAVRNISAASSQIDDGDLVRAIAGGVRWLRVNQLPDGSWPTVPVLRVPGPAQLAPWRQTSWRESLVGLDVIVPDWRRLFVTVTSVNALRTAASTEPPGQRAVSGTASPIASTSVDRRSAAHP